jgi:hypothetical protein
LQTADDGLPMTDDQLLRYSRHILLDDLGIEGQAPAAAAQVLVIGAGGLGSPVLLYLATAGVGRITVVDGDTVDLTNLQRQIAHATARVGQPKVDSAAQAMAALNPEVQVRALARRVDADELLRPGGRGRRGDRLQRQLRHPPGGQCRLRGARPAAGVRRGHRLRRPGVGLRHCASRTPLVMPACSPPM